MHMLAHLRKCLLQICVAYQEIIFKNYVKKIKNSYTLLATVLTLELYLISILSTCFLLIYLFI